MQLGAEAAVAIVEANDEVAALDQLLAELFFPRNHLCGEAHDQQERLIGRVAKGVVLDFHLAVVGRGKRRFWHMYSLTPV